MTNEELAGQTIAKLEDLILQATTERSHYYVANSCREAVATIKQLESALSSSSAEWRGILERVNQDYINQIAALKEGK